MAILTSSQQTFVDITDQRKLSAYITSNLPKTQVENPNVLPHTYTPSWAGTALKLTPVIFLDQTAVSLSESGLTITWKRKDGTGAEAALTTGESVSGGILTVSQDKLAASASGMLTYICYISYYDDETKNTVNITSDITYTLVKNAENARLAYATADTYVFKYNTSSSLVGATQANINGQVQGVNLVKWQYKNASGAWVDYPTTSDNVSITGSTLVVKPTHAVFFNNTAQIRLLTDDDDVYDTLTITKMYDGEKGATGSGGLSVILGNEAQSIACTNAGLIQAAVDVEIPFVGYVGITQTACTCAVGTLPSGVTTKSNTAATASAAGKLVLTFAANATLGSATTMNGSIPLTFSISGKSVSKRFSWSKSVKGDTGAAGAAGANAVVFSIYTPQGSVFQNQEGTLLLDTAAYDGSMVISSGATYQWAKYTSGTWQNISNATGKSLTVNGADVVNVQSYRCTMTYKSKTYQDVVTIEDKADTYVSEMLAIGGFSFKNNLGGKAVYVIVRANGKEVDPLLGSISTTAPSSPKSGDYWYKVDHSAKTVTLMKYSGSAWATASDGQELVYTWYMQDGEGNAVSAWEKEGKVIYLHADDVDSMCTLQCDVEK